jgi:hypothetical protein
MTFAAITPALIVGAFAERMKFSAVALFIPLWVTLIYFPIAHMVWYWAGPDAITDAAKALAAAADGAAKTAAQNTIRTYTIRVMRAGSGGWAFVSENYKHPKYSKRNLPNYIGDDVGPSAALAGKAETGHHESATAKRVARPRVRVLGVASKRIGVCLSTPKIAGARSPVAPQSRQL